jgi:hypothetical protein
MHVKPTFNITDSLLLGINHACFNGYKGIVGEKKPEPLYIIGSGAVLARSSQPMVGLMMNFRK